MQYVIVLITLLEFLKISGSFAQDSTDVMNNINTNNHMEQYKKCFNKYTERSDNILRAYETNYNECLNTRMTATDELNAIVREQRGTMFAEVRERCVILHTCPKRGSIEKILQCYMDQAFASIQEMYNVHVNASVTLATIKERSFLITTEEYKCTNETKRLYEKKSTELYVGFNNCVSAAPDNSYMHYLTIIYNNLTSEKHGV